MCLVLLAYRQHAAFPVVLIANRDEYHERPTDYAQYWQDTPQVLAGRDRNFGGTWLGVERSGRFAAVTNYREPSQRKPGVVSRGLLVSRYLQGEQTPEQYLDALIPDREQYDAFNLLLGDQSTVHFYSSLEGQGCEITAGIYGISNGEFDCPWPKVEKGKRFLLNEIEHENVPRQEEIFTLLADTTLPEDKALPDTGIGLEWERKLAPIFVRADKYGTRASTILTISEHGSVSFIERNYDREGSQINTNQFEFEIMNGN